MSDNINESYNKNRATKQQNETDPVVGIFLGIVRATLDKDRSGKFMVEVPALNKTSSKNVLYPCYLASPFAGSTNAENIGKDIETHDDTITSYGMWMQIPDEGNRVLVAFGDGNTKQGYIIGCVFPDKFNHMVPGMASGKSYSDPNLLMPVSEKNKRDDKPTHNDATRPINWPFAENIIKQGLINDKLRGVGTASGRRESPSEVFGILTPGPKDPDNKKSRLAGHQFIMDDNLDSRMIRIRSAGGNQLLLDDTTGIIYMINKLGTAWFEMNTMGDINFYSEGSINMRAKGNFNLRADKNINIEAGQDLHLKAAGDNIGDTYVGIPALGALGVPPLGNGGNIRFEAAADLTQYAGLNAQLTANGGDVDIGAGSRVALTASGPLGFDILAATGPIKMQSTLPTSILSAAGFNVTASAPASITAPLILLNSGGAPALPALPAIPAPQIGTQSKKDAAKDPAKFEKESAKKGKTAAPTAGERTGMQDTVKTIVTTMLTAEPYVGHAQHDPVAESAKAPQPDPNLVNNLPDSAVDMSGKPVDVSTPKGFLKGVGYTDKNGNPITSAVSTATGATSGLKAAASVAADPVKAASSKLSSTFNSTKSAVESASKAASTVSGAANKINSLSGTASSTINSVTGKLGDVSGQAQELLNGIPNFSDVQGVLNDFKAQAKAKLMEITGLKDLVAGIKAAIPPIRFPTSNALGQKVVGTLKQLKEMEAQLKQFSLDKLGLPIDLDMKAITDMKGAIGDAMKVAKDATQLANTLKQQGISMIADGPGTIFEDALGNKLVDFTNGIGPIGDTLGLVSEMNKTFENVKGSIYAPLSGNQTLAITQFANAIGEENFLKSNVLDALNEGKYAAVPRLMQGWVLAPNSPGADATFQQTMKNQRMFESSMFQTPDEVDLSNFAKGYLPGSTNFAELSTELDAIRSDFIATKELQNGAG